MTRLIPILLRAQGRVWINPGRVNYLRVVHENAFKDMDHHPHGVLISWRDGASDMLQGTFDSKEKAEHHIAAIAKQWKTECDE